MNLRLLLVLITVLSYVAIGVTWFITNPTEEVEEPQPPFFYTLASDDLRNIAIKAGDVTASWSFREESRRWFFDEYENIPADLFRWGGIPQLLGGPRTQRVLSQEIEDESIYGLNTPSTSIMVTLRDGKQLEMILGDRTPDEAHNYARMVGFPQLVLIDATWGEVLERLVLEPPLPEWFYTLDGQVREVILFDNNEVVRAYGYDRDNESWALCDPPLVTDPCTGSQTADAVALNTELEHFGSPKIGGVVALSLEEDTDYEPYGTTLTSPYIAVRIENKTTQGVTEVTRLTMTIGDMTEDGKFRYAVANETSDVITVDAEWADRVLELFFGDPLIDNG
ncbi:MAG: DUF4340 domain-containing protein [Dehalococcoidia bacterium]|jgi:hypothetical protein|nr:DUF4340 domain-containing protein [Dehalococcoidia bacterium]